MRICSFLISPNPEAIQSIKLKVAVGQCHLIHYLHTKFRPFLRWSLFFLVELIWNDPIRDTTLDHIQRGFMV